MRRAFSKRCEAVAFPPLPRVRTCVRLFLFLYFFLFCDLIPVIFLLVISLVLFFFSLPSLLDLRVRDLHARRMVL